MVHVLLVDDDEGDVFFIQEALEGSDQNYDLYHCVDGVCAQKFLQAEDKPRPDLILLDLNMPRMDGHEFLKWIKAQEDYKDIPVGILTTSVSQDDISRSYKNYANFYITKPANLTELKNVITSIDNFWIKTAKLPNAESS